MTDIDPYDRLEWAYEVYRNYVKTDEMVGELE